MPTQSKNDILTSRIPPQAVEVEEAILGSMLLDSDAVDITAMSLKVEDFYKSSHQHIYAAMIDLYEAARPVDLISIENKLRDRSLLEDIGGTAYLADLMRSVSATSSVEYHCTIVKNKSKARQAIMTFDRLIDQAYDSSSDIYKILNNAEDFVYNAITGETTRQTATIKTVMEESFEYIASIQGTEGGIIGIPSGLDYDQVTSGWQKGKMYTIAGRPGMGKTAFVLKNLKNAAHQGYKPGIISLEMGRRSLGTRMMLEEARVDNQRAMQGKLSEEEMVRVNEAATKLMDLGMVIDDTTNLTPPLLRIKARMMKQVHKIDILAIDYLQLMTSEGKQSREQEVADISRTCKLLAKELDIPVLALAQLSREPDKRPGWKSRPQLSDLRESGAIEQDSDVVIFLYRPEVYKLKEYEDGTSTDGVTEVIIAKHREGPIGLKKIFFAKETMSFENLSRQNSQILPPLNPHNQPDWLHD